ncbi:helix-turn-helix domain-containing protein [Microvirga antarctica]|uniref:helix-turn-helix domain-containing protein n=1 Tax=Microvirga antarctica TaxID=2819233 RepID=UPI001B300AC0
MSKNFLPGRSETEKPLLVDIPETGRLLGVGKTSVYALIKSGKLKTRRILRRNLITRDSIDALADNSEGAAL